MKRARVIVRVLGLLFLPIVLLPYVLRPTSLGAVLKTLPFGWVQFLKRNIPQLNFDWGLIATGLICTGGLFLLGNWFMSALFRQLQSPQSPDSSAAKWKWSWTVGAYAGIWLLFLIAFGSAGVLRHTTWLLNSTEPWHEERLNFYMELMSACGAMEQAMTEAGLDIEKTRQTMAAERGYRRSEKPLFEDFNIILYSNSSNEVTAYLIIPRNPKMLAKGNFAAGAPKTPGEILPLSQLQATILEKEAEAATLRR